MLDITRLRDIVSHRVTLDYENGARIVGYAAQTRPASGPVQALGLAAVLLYSPGGDLVGRRDELSVVPDLLVGKAEDGARVVLEFESGARLEGRRREPQPSEPGFLTLEGVAIHERSGRIIERHDALTIVPETLLALRITEGPLGT